MPEASVGEIAELYLGNLLYAIERCALSLEADDKALDAAFYRGIGRKLADAHGRTKTRPTDHRSPDRP
ncbi:hypothetical protein [Gemmatimonas sp.]|uniref:hypothetical protein n=1 Tax=Gemmatimonas sp. TaxID=1962908 RepID=UPI00286D95B7|nr:hypothetical protein [Gemmatimonas sp.]